MHTLKKPNVITISGLDPSGGAGIQADIQALTAQHCHALPIISALTVQDSHNVYQIKCIDPHFIDQQIQCILNDFNISAIKVGLLGSQALISYLIDLFQTLDASIPIIVDPIKAAGGGASLSEASFCDDYLRLLPFTTVLTPNTDELQWLSPHNHLKDSASALLALGLKHLLVTGTHQPAATVTNRLFSQSKGLISEHQWPRLAFHYHGSGCTLAAFLAAFLAHGDDVESASYKAQAATWQSLKCALHQASGQLFPNRAAPVLTP